MNLVRPCTPADYVFQNHHSRNGSYTTRHGSQCPCYLGDAGEIHVPYGFAIDAVNPYIDDDGPGFDHISRYEPRRPGSTDQDIGPPCCGFQIMGTGMAMSNGRIAVQAQLGQWFADDIAPANDDDIFPRE